MILLLLGVAPALAFPVRAPRPKPAEVRFEAGRLPDVLIVKLAENAGLRWEDGRVRGADSLDGLNALLAGARPRFSRDPAAIRAHRATWDPEGRLADLTLYLRLEAPDAAARGTALLADPRVQNAWLAYAPMPPPVDIEPETPDFSGEQGYLGPAPEGLGLSEAAAWPGGTGVNVAIADLEYGWENEHEDLDAAPEAFAAGWESGEYEYHGTSVLGMLVAGDNGYGVTGLAPEAEVVMVSPWADARGVDIAAMIDEATALLDAGDVLLIEMQAYAEGALCPVEVDEAVFDAISLAVAAGIVVVEPTGNGGVDLDSDVWEGWFDRSLRDSGAILVGAGASPESSYEARDWYPHGSGYGSRVDLQGWYDHIATATNDYAGGAYADLYYPGGDGRQAYTSTFGGSSGASAMIAGVAAVAQSIALSVWGEPWDPYDLRAALVSTGTPQAGDGERHVGPQPDLRRLLRTWMVR